jgi:hypothetical protein
VETRKIGRDRDYTFFVAKLIEGVAEGLPDLLGRKCHVG